MNKDEKYIYRKGMTPQTRSIVSSKNKVYAKPAGHKQFLQLGVVSTFDPSQSRPIEAIRGIGYGDQIAELVPGQSDVITISVTRTALYLSLLMQTFGYKAGVDGMVRALKHHRWPFDIKQEIVLSEAVQSETGGFKGLKTSSEAGLSAMLTFYEACWMQDYSVSFSVDSAMVSEQCTIAVSDILDGQSDYSQLAIKNTDTGNKMGSFRFSGSIDNSTLSNTPGSPTGA